MAFSGANKSLGEGEDLWERWVQSDEERSEGGSELIRVDLEITLRIRPIQRAADSPPNKAESEESDLSQASEDCSEADAEERKSADEELLGAVGEWNPFQKEGEKENKAPQLEWNPWAMNWWSQEGGRQPLLGYAKGLMAPKEGGPRPKVGAPGATPQGSSTLRPTETTLSSPVHGRKRGGAQGMDESRKNGKASGDASQVRRKCGLGQIPGPLFVMRGC